MRASLLLTRILGVYQEKGGRGFWFALAGRVGYRRLIAFEKRLDEPWIQLVPKTEAAVRELQRDDEAAFVALGQTSAVIFRERLDRGHRCWGAWCAGGLRSVAWIAFKEAPVEYLGCRLILADGVVYVYGAFTQPEYRGLGLTLARAAGCLRAVREQGCTLALCAVQPENPPAFPPVLKLGYRRVGVISSLGAGAFRWFHVRLDSGRRAADGWRVAGAARGFGPL